MQLRYNFRITPDDTAIPPEDCPGTGDPDTTAPTVHVDGLTDGDELSVAAREQVSVSATDETSEQPELVIELDGKAVTAPVVLDGVDLLAGAHSITVSATDEAGNRTQQKIDFSVVAGWANGTALIDRLAGEKLLPRSAPVTLRAHWRAAQAETESGRTDQAALELDRFSATAGQISDARSRTALVDLARKSAQQLTSARHQEKRTT